MSCKYLEKLSCDFESNVTERCGFGGHLDKSDTRSRVSYQNQEKMGKKAEDRTTPGTSTFINTLQKDED